MTRIKCNNYTEIALHRDTNSDRPAGAQRSGSWLRQAEIPAHRNTQTPPREIPPCSGQDPGSSSVQLAVVQERYYSAMAISTEPRNHLLTSSHRGAVRGPEEAPQPAGGQASARKEK